MMVALSAVLLVLLMNTGEALLSKACAEPARAAVSSSGMGCMGKRGAERGCGAPVGRQTALGDGGELYRFF